MSATPTLSVSVDPGLTRMGVALWHSPRHVEETFTLIGGDEEEWDQRSVILARLLEGQVRDHLAWLADERNQVSMFYPDHVELLIEFPMLMQSTAGIAANRGGGTLKLAFLVGAICALPVWDSYRIFTPMEWKGQLPKHVVEQRIRKTLGAARCAKLQIVKDEWDAVGIGLHGLGVWA